MEPTASFNASSFSPEEGSPEPAPTPTGLPGPAPGLAGSAAPGAMAPDSPASGPPPAGPAPSASPPGAPPPGYGPHAYGPPVPGSPAWGLPGAAWPPAPGQPPPGWPQPYAPYVPPPARRYLALRSGIDRPVAIAALIGGVMLDVAYRVGLATIAAAAWVAVVAVALLLSGRIRGRSARACMVAAAGTALLYAFRSSPWVLVPVTIAVAAALLLGASLGADRGGPASTFPALGNRVILAVGHLIFAPGMLRSPRVAAPSAMLPAPGAPTPGLAGAVPPGPASSLAGAVPPGPASSLAGAVPPGPASDAAGAAPAGPASGPAVISPAGPPPVLDAAADPAVAAPAAPGTPAPGTAAAARRNRRRAAAIGRGVLIGGPILLLIWALLAAADPIFWSWFDIPSAIEHVILVLTGAWAVTGLARAASAREPSPPLSPAPRVSVIEAGILVGGLCALYAAFVAAQFVALSAIGHHILAARGLNYAQYARSGFFQLLACAAITMLVLLIVRACAPPHPWLTALYLLAAVLTIGVVSTAIRRLNLYVAHYGLTMLRLSSLVAAAWIGLVFALIGLSIARPGRPRRYLPAAILVSALVFTIGWSIANPAAFVARVNLGRAAHGHPLDVSQAASLGTDAMPTLLSGLSQLSPAQARQLRLAICAAEPPADPAAAFSMSVTSARSAVARAGCAGLGQYLAAHPWLAAQSPAPGG